MSDRPLSFADSGLEPTAHSWVSQSGTRIDNQLGCSNTGRHWTDHGRAAIRPSRTAVFVVLRPQIPHTRSRPIRIDGTKSSVNAWTSTSPSDHPSAAWSYDMRLDARSATHGIAPVRTLTGTARRPW